RDYKVTGVQTCALPISRAYYVNERTWKLTWTIFLALRLRRSPTAVSAERKIVDHARSLDAGNRFHTPEDLLEDLTPLFDAISIEIGRASCRERVEIAER